TPRSVIRPLAIGMPKTAAKAADGPEAIGQPRLAARNGGRIEAATYCKVVAVSRRLFPDFSRRQLADDRSPWLVSSRAERITMVYTGVAPSMASFAEAFRVGRRCDRIPLLP